MGDEHPRLELATAIASVKKVTKVMVRLVVMGVATSATSVGQLV